MRAVPLLSMTGTTVHHMDAFVEMTGTGVASALPDVVVLDTAVRTPGGSVAEALSRADTAMTAIVGIARQRGLAPADLQTTSASVYPQYDREGVSVSGYIAQQSIRLRIRDRDLVGPLITAFSESVGNALAIDNISLQIDDVSPLLTQARRLAFEDANAKARQFAELASRELGPVLYVVDSPSPGGGLHAGGAPKREMMMASASADMPVEMGENSIRCQVTVRWAWA